MSGDPANPAISPETFNAVLEQMIPRAHQMGVEVVELRPGYVRARVPFEGNGNHLGTVYAGVLFIVAEILGGAIAFSTFDVTRFYPVVKDLRINFRRPARSAVTATAAMSEEQVEELRSEAEASGKAQFIFETELTDADGELVATTEGTYQLRRHGS